MKEAQFQTLFSRWAKNTTKKPTAWELKISNNGKPIPFKAVAEHQLRALWNTQEEGIYYKIPDSGMGQKPYDCFFIKGPAFVVVMYYEPRKPKVFYMIPIRDWVRCQNSSKRKSLTELMAKDVATKTIKLKS